LWKTLGSDMSIFRILRVDRQQKGYLLVIIVKRFYR